jgi:guanosine-3',5'-bis(diphosphate) 3'-pyrophosphohydrolase
MQRRKDTDASPYINHAIEVAELLAAVGGVTDLELLQAAVLHDTLEDTQTSRDELQAQFGLKVRSLVEEVTDDKRLPHTERKRLQVEHAPSLSDQAKELKVADKICNVRDLGRSAPKGWSLERCLEYLDWAERVVGGCRGVNAALDASFDAALLQSRRGFEVDLAAIKTQIHEAFADVEYPGDWCLIQSREGTEPALLEEEFRGKTDWRTLEPSFIDQAPDGFGTALSFFSDEAFHFYLPAFLLADLESALNQAHPVFALTHGLDNASRHEKINPRRYGERTWFEHARHKFAMFNSQESEAIVGYLTYKLHTDTLMDSEKVRVREALDNYWTTRMACG